MANSELLLNEVDISKVPPSSDKTALSFTQAHGVTHCMPEMGAANSVIQRQIIAILWFKLFLQTVSQHNSLLFPPGRGLHC